MKRDLALILASLALIASSVVLMSSCGAQATGLPRSVEISAPQLGFRCFAILNGQGEAIGGNCLKD